MRTVLAYRKRRDSALTLGYRVRSPARVRERHTMELTVERMGGSQRQLQSVAEVRHQRGSGRLRPEAGANLEPGKPRDQPLCAAPSG